MSSDNYSFEQLESALRKADAAGDVQAATQLANAIRTKNGSDKYINSRVANGHDGNQDAVQQATIGHKAGAVIDGVAQGLTFGFSDEIAAGLDSGFGLFGDYDKSLEAERWRMDENKRLAGGYELAGQLTGAVTSGVGLSKLGLLASTRLAPTAGLKAKVLAGAADGAVGGTLYGAGTGEDLESRTTGALTGGALGGTLGAALPVAGTAIKSAFKPVQNAIAARTNPESFAAKKLAERFSADGVDLNQAEKRLKDGLNLADVGGESARNLLRTTTNLPGKAQSRVAQRLAMRQIQQGDRLKSSIAKTFADPDGYLATKDALAAQAKKLAEPLYKEAYANPIPFTQSLEGILKTTSGNSALKKAMSIASDEQAPFKQWFANVADDGATTIKKVPDMRAWDYIKRGFDDMIDGQTDSITGKVTNQGRAIINLKNRMLSELDKANPAYADARKTWSGFAKMDEALEYGKKAINQSPESVRRTFANMSEAEMQSARIGYAESLRKKIDDAGFTHNSIQKIMGNRSSVNRLRAMFKSTKDFQEFRRTMVNEAKKQKTFNAVRGNSTTVRQLMDMQEAGGLNNEAVGATAELTTGRFGQFASRVGGWISQAGGLTPEVADEMAQKLLTTNPQTIKSVFRQLERLEKLKVSDDRKATLIRDAINRAITTQTVQQLQH